jgi:hypothetical protein
LPGQVFQRVVAGIEKIERRTGIVAFLLLGLVLYWCLRLLYVW